MSLYAPLAARLRALPHKSVTMTFEDVASIVGKRLTDAAFDHRPWWANDSTHTQARNGWLAAGWRTAGVDMRARRVTFVRR